MIDYHYCSKNLHDYPTNKQKEIAMIRMCSRKEDIKKALEFGERLKKYTKINVSFNVFNAANYSSKELLNTCKLIAKYKMDYVYFADTHLAYAWLQSRYVHIRVGGGGKGRENQRRRGR